MASALMHFLWQGAVLAAAAWAAMRWLTSSALRAIRDRHRDAGGDVGHARRDVPPGARAARDRPRGDRRAPNVTDAHGRRCQPTRRPRQVPRRRSRILPFVTLAWLAGVLALSVRLTGGWIVARRLASRTVVDGRQPTSSVSRPRVADRLGVRQCRSPGRVVDAVAVPVVIGWLKPVVLVPAAALSGLTPRSSRRSSRTSSRTSDGTTISSTCSSPSSRPCSSTTRRSGGCPRACARSVSTAATTSRCRCATASSTWTR